MGRTLGSCAAPELAQSSYEHRNGISQIGVVANAVEEKYGDETK